MEEYDDNLYQVLVAGQWTHQAQVATTVDRAFLRQHCEGISELELRQLKPVYLVAGDSVTVNYSRAYTHLDIDVAVLLKMQLNGVLSVMPREPEPLPSKGVWQRIREKFKGS